MSLFEHLPQSPRQLRRGRLLAALVLCCLLWGATGCKRDTTPAAQIKGGSPNSTSAANARDGQSAAPATGTGQGGLRSSPAADGILLAMVKAYREAAGYSDRAIAQVSYRVAGQQLGDSAPLSLIFERPQRLRLEAYRSVVVSDGEKFYARIEDESTGNIDNQVVVRPAPAKLHLQDIYGDALLAQVIGSGLARYPVQLELLLDEQPLASALSAEAKRSTQTPAAVEGHPCDRVAVTSADGTYVFWIDQQSHLLRRLEYPTGHLMSEAGTDEEVQDLSLTVEFRDARFEAPSAADTYRLDIPENARQVRYFVPPPQPLPTNLFGQSPADFSLKTLSGQPVNSASLQGKVVVLVWFNNHEAGNASLVALNSVAQQFAGQDQFAFYGICTEPSSVTDLQIENLMREWRVEVPIARDLAAIGRDVFSVPVWPTMIVLDAQGRVQLFEAGHIQPAYDALPEVLPQIAAGENLGAKIAESYQTELDDYQHALAVAAGAADSNVVEIPTVEIAPRSEPSAFKLSEVWHTGDVPQAGNLLFIPGENEQAARLAVLSANRNVIELDLAGEIIATHELALSDGGGVQHLIAATDGQGNRYFAAWANLGKQMHILDREWKLIASYPDLKQEHDGIRDCTLGDLSGDGTLAAYAAFWGAAGVHKVSLEGKRQWTNRAATAPIALAIGPANAAEHRQLLISTAAGNLVPLNPFGRESAPVTIGSYAVHELVRSPLSDMTTPYCAFSFTAEGTTRAIAVDADFVERWSYELPEGAHRNALRAVAAGMVLPGSAGDWIFAGADGSIHAIAADGSASDFFYFGQKLTGLAAARGGSDLLFIATDKGVYALRLEK